ncbi:hypothetical protein J3459_010835 [Metarhizium acridum]|nr:hypothetical protein J3459_010835 [Metarhizium acridum]
MALTSGDLLSSLDDVEGSLAYFLALGQRYGALVLLDEADVYLEHRTASDVARNGLVSVFLRALEYTAACCSSPPTGYSRSTPRSSAGFMSRCTIRTSATRTGSASGHIASRDLRAIQTARSMFLQRRETRSFIMRTFRC